ncbi:MAG TPA: cell envelope integrity protein TolA, partial [Gammaproteobacteria bacterium]|nr:cell envelope integrity protein TolA [Gammaproteobacteria bacterium]
MWKFLREHPRSLFYALLVHVGLFGLLVVGVDWTAKPSASGKPDVVQAVVVDESKVKDEMAQLKKAQTAKQRQAQAELEKLKAQAKQA